MTETNPTEGPAQTAPAEEITVVGKWIAGILLSAFSLGAILFIIAYWPDRIPGPKDGLKPLNICQPFHVRLACIPETVCCLDSFNSSVTGSPASPRKTDTLRAAKKDSAGKDDTGVAKKGRTAAREDSAVAGAAPSTSPPCSSKNLINLNVLLMLLVAATAFTLTVSDEQNKVVFTNTFNV